jgi:hypothetical protein
MDLPVSRKHHYEKFSDQSDNLCRIDDGGCIFLSARVARGERRA